MSKMKTAKKRSAEFINHNTKRSRSYSDSDDSAREYTAGKIERIFVRNFMCHDALEVRLNENVNFIVGQNGSGKSAILMAVTIGLGARANVTSRGTSVKNFIKAGRKSALIEITLTNKGLRAFKPDIYGDCITVVRIIGSNNKYKLKSSKGEVITTKRDELDNLLSTMNIQIDNPISILNQDVSRTFLVSSKPKEKYELFMKATRLDVSGNNYRKARTSSEEVAKKLESTNEVLAKTKKEVSELKEKLKRIKDLDVTKKQIQDLDMELQWAIALSEEAKLQNCEENLKRYNEKVNELKDRIASVGSNGSEIDVKMKELQAKIQEIEQETLKQSTNYDTMKEKYTSMKEIHFTKTKEWRNVQSKIARLEGDITFLNKEIERIEGGNAGQEEKEEKKKRLTELQQKLDEAEAMIRTKQTDRMHLESNAARRKQEINKIRIDIDSNTIRIRKIKQDLSNLKQQADNALTVFGPNIPRVHKCIEEEYKKGRFKRKPIGPIGAYIKMKDPAWAPAVETFLGSSLLSTFLVDNSADAKTLYKIIKEIFVTEISPQIIASKFYNKVHNITKRATYSPRYPNMLQAMEISYPDVANCLIDQREIECILLIPTNEECCHVMSNAKNVPPNCKRAINQKADTFFPDPNYRSYGSRCVARAKYLQVSTTQAINHLEEELSIAEKERYSLQEKYKTICKEVQQTEVELRDIVAKLSKLESTQGKLKTAINELMDMFQIETKQNEAMAVVTFHNELAELKQKLQQEKSEEKRLTAEIAQLKNDLEVLEKEIQQHRNLRCGLNMRIAPLKEEISRLSDEKELLRTKHLRINSELETNKAAARHAAMEFEKQKEITDKLISDASEYCPRIETKRSEVEIKSLQKSLKEQVKKVEQILGTKENLSRQLEEKQSQLGNVIEFAAAIEEYNKIHLERLKRRKLMYEEMKATVGEKVQSSFANVLALRNYTGHINIDHVHMLVDLEVNPPNRKNPTNYAKSLSGGERSYSMVAFILALWECTEMPFYFLDEFDVFMDKVNRRIIMDILLDHTKSHPQSQFTFLTPLDTSNVVGNGFISIHQLDAPKRTIENH